MDQKNNSSVVFSVLICSLGGSTLAKAVKSIFVGDYTNLEVVIVIDNPSVDAEPILKSNLSKSEFSRVKIINNKENIGVAKSANKGIEHCRGKYICRLDDDDYFVEGRLQKAQDFFENNPKVGILTGGAKVQVASGASYTLCVPSSHEEIEKCLNRRNILVHSTLHIRMDVLKKAGGYNDDFYYAVDYELYLRMLRAGVKFASLDTPLVERVEGDASITINKRRQQALYSLAALSLHHAITWKSEKKILKAILVSFIRFYSPKIVRTIIRKLRSLKRNVRL